VRRSRCAVLVLASCGGGAAPEPAEPPPEAAVRCEAIAAREVEDVVELTGVVAPPPRRDAVLSAPIAGRVAQLAVEEGDTVAAGALIGSIEDPTLAAGRIESAAGVTAAQAVRDAADADAARQARLLERGIAARKDVDEARARAASAAAELQAAQARAGLATQQLARRDVRAPFAGTVLHVLRRAGEHVDGTASTPLAELADLSILEVRAQVAPRAMLQLRDGQAAHVEVAGAPPLAATVARVSPAVDATTLLGTVRLQLTDAPRLPVGTAATARVVIARHPGLVVPRAALRRAETGAEELVVCEAGKVARIRRVTVGQRTPGGAEITAGLTAGEAVVVDHALGLEDGQRLAPPAGGPRP
jgi:RND family efflux transporter MFP subunit